jgi:hypothetical protein
MRQFDVSVRSHQIGREGRVENRMMAGPAFALLVFGASLGGCSGPMPDQRAAQSGAPSISPQATDAAPPVAPDNWLRPVVAPSYGVDMGFTYN